MHIEKDRKTGNYGNCPKCIHIKYSSYPQVIHIGWITYVTMCTVGVKMCVTEYGNQQCSIQGSIICGNSRSRRYLF